MNQQELDNIIKLHKKWLVGEKDGVCADLRGVNFSGANLRNTDLRGVNFSGANLRNADLRGADLRGFNFSGADLRGVNFSGADLRGVNFSGADLRGVNFSGADLRGVNFSGADLDYACWPLWCGSLQVKGDEQLIGQLLYHALDLAKHSGVGITSIKQLKALANNSNPVVKHKKEKV